MNKALDYLKENGYHVIRRNGSYYIGTRWATYENNKICGAKSKVKVSIDTNKELVIEELD